MKIVLKELKETRVCVKVISRAKMIEPVERMNKIKSENEELISIIVKSIDTAKKNIEAGKK